MRRMALTLVCCVACSTEPAPAQPAQPASQAEPAQPQVAEPKQGMPSPGAVPLTQVAKLALSADEQATLRRAQRTAGAFGKSLKSTLQAAMKSGGPVAAFGLCTAQAQPMTAAVQGDDVALGRASLRLRNPANRPPEWVQMQLDDWGERSAAGLEATVMRTERDVRIVMPLAVEGACLHCHGARKALQPEVRALLDRHYPADQAVEYKLGDLRGALWALARTEPDPPSDVAAQ